MFCLSELFFTDDQAILKALQALAPFPSHVRHCLIVGPEYSGKTSALFHYAFNLASSGKNVYIVCQKAKLEQQPPLLSEGVSSSDAAFSRIHIRYLASSAELQRFAAFLHLLQDFPDAILIDGLCSFTADRSLQHNKRPTEAELVKMLALLHEAVNSARWVLRGRHHGHGSASNAGTLCEAQPCTVCIAVASVPAFGAGDSLQWRRLIRGPGQEQAVKDDGPCLVVTESQENSAKFLYVLRRWLPLTLFIRETDGECSISVLPESARALGLPPDSMAEVVYSVVPYSCISLIGVRPAVERGISTGHRAGEHTVAVSRQ